MSFLNVRSIVLSPEQKGRLACTKITTIQKNGGREKILEFNTKKQFDDCTLLRNLLNPYDFLEDNIIFTEDGKVAYIDTEIIQDHIIENFIDTVINLAN